MAVRLLDDINASVQRYRSMLLATNVLVALLTWIALRWIGLENAGAWAMAAGLLHVIPYMGPACGDRRRFIQFYAVVTALEKTAGQPEPRSRR